MTPIEEFIKWMENEKESTTATVAFEFLMISTFPSKDINGNSKELIDKLKLYLSSENDIDVQIRNILLLHSSVSFFVRKYGHIDQFINTQNLMAKRIEEGLEKGQDVNQMKQIYDSGNDRFQDGIEIKNSWSEFRANSFNFEAIEKFYLEGMANKLNL